MLVTTPLVNRYLENVYFIPMPNKFPFPLQYRCIWICKTCKISRFWSLLSTIIFIGDVKTRYDSVTTQWAPFFPCLDGSRIWYMEMGYVLFQSFIFSLIFPVLYDDIVWLLQILKFTCRIFIFLSTLAHVIEKNCYLLSHFLRETLSELFKPSPTVFRFATFIRPKHLHR